MLTYIGWVYPDQWNHRRSRQYWHTRGIVYVAEFDSYLSTFRLSTLNMLMRVYSGKTIKNVVRLCCRTKLESTSKETFVKLHGNVRNIANEHEFHHCELQWGILICAAKPEPSGYGVPGWKLSPGPFQELTSFEQLVIVNYICFTSRLQSKIFVNSDLQF